MKRAAMILLAVLLGAALGPEARAQQPYLVKDIHPGPGVSNITALTDVEGTLFFVATDGTEASRKLWKSDGTAGGTVPVASIPANGSLETFTSLRGQLFFFARGPAAGWQLWKSDGTARGTMMLREFTPHGCELVNLSVWNGHLYFTADDGSRGCELWRTDGTSGGTTMVTDLDPGAGSSYPLILLPDESRLVVVTVPRFGLPRLWTSDGTARGTRPVTSLPSLTLFCRECVALVGETLYFTGGYFLSDGSVSPQGHELWSADLLSGRTALVEDIYPGPYGSRPSNFGVIDGILYFIADDGTHFQALWRSDGTAAGTVRLSDERRGGYQSLTAVQGRLFSLWFGGGDYRLWTSDGTPRGTREVSHSLVRPGRGPGPLLHTHGVIVLEGFDPEHGWELWTSDGTERGSRLLADLNPGPGASNVYNLTRSGSHLFFTAYDGGPTGVELWAIRLSPDP